MIRPGQRQRPCALETRSGGRVGLRGWTKAQGCHRGEIASDRTMGGQGTFLMSFACQYRRICTDGSMALPTTCILAEAKIVYRVSKDAVSQSVNALKLALGFPVS